MILLKDKNGTVIAELSEQMFPVQIMTDTSTATHKIYAKFITEGGNREIKAMNMGK